MPPTKEAEYNDLEVLKSKRSVGGDIASFQALDAAQEALCVFRPVMLHSLDRSLGKVWYHAQMLADFGTVEAIASAIRIELRR